MAKLTRRFEEYQPSKTALFWSCVGSVVVVLILGFTWGGWTTGGTAQGMAEEAAEEARAQVAAAVCVERFMNAATARTQLTSLKEIDSSWERENFVEEGGWVTIADEEYDDAAELCAEMLVDKELPATEQEAAEPEAGTTVQ